jgi:fumarylacetoacetate (FAA) hydrolase
VKLATLKNGSRDGRLVVVSRDLTLAADATSVAPTLLAALEAWPTSAARLRELYDRLNESRLDGAFDFPAGDAAAPLPRAPQWCDGSAFLNHGELMQKAFKLPPIADVEMIPLMYQGGSDDMLGPHDDIAALDEAHGIDFEGEFGVIVGDVPLGCPPSLAGERILLLVQINDVSLRTFAPREMRTGFGFFQSKPSSSFAPVAVTPDELGGAWREYRVHLDLNIDYNGAWFGNPNGGEMHFGFDRLVAHAAGTRRLSAGTIIGSGTVSNTGGRKGSACIAERRAIEAIEHGSPRTPFMRFGDRVRMEAATASPIADPDLPTGRPPTQPIFGAIDQRVVQASAPQA